ncbi:MAG: F0F1 ATP synthase subunit A [Actinobacteria bacterium]|nr:F0F1 ATP synthase subunit A [Actinomycetota bacterium]
MNISPDSTVLWSWGPVHINLTIVFTWVVMALVVTLAWLATRNLKFHPPLSRWQNIFEAVVTVMRNHIHDILGIHIGRYLPFIGTLFLFISFSNLLIVLPGFEAPTGSLSTTLALAICVFISVPIYSISEVGVRGYLKHFIEPSPLMLPMHLLTELTRTLTLAVRLFGNIMSESMIGAAILAVVPFLLPVVMKGFGLLIGQIQAYIFVVLASIYIASASGMGEVHGSNGSVSGDGGSHRKNHSSKGVRNG